MGTEKTVVCFQGQGIMVERGSDGKLFVSIDDTTGKVIVKMNGITMIGSNEPMQMRSVSILPNHGSKEEEMILTADPEKRGAMFHVHCGDWDWVRAEIAPVTP